MNDMSVDETKELKRDIKQAERSDSISERRSNLDLKVTKIKEAKDMSSEIDLKIAEFILQKTGFIDHRAELINEIEDELATIYSELDNNLNLSFNADEPPRYYQEVETIFDMVSNGEIHKSFYNNQSKNQRMFLKSITNNQDFYVNVRRGKGFNFSQYWDFNLSLNKSNFNIEYDEQLSFELHVGIREPFPYEIQMKSRTSDITSKIILEKLQIFKFQMIQTNLF